MKTGTTFLQSLLLENRDELLEAGLLFPNENGRRALQSAAVHERLGLSWAPVHGGAWERLAAQVEGHRGASVVSHEFMSFAGRARARRLVEGFGDAEVHAVLTVRDARSLAPSVWQTRVRNAGLLPWSEYAAQLSAVPPDAESDVWRRWRRAQGTPRMLEVWSSILPPDRIHLVTLPASGPRSLLWDRFAEVLGVDPALATRLPRASNPSMGHPSAELTRRVNLALGVDRRSVQQTVAGTLAQRILSQRRDDEPAIEVTGPLLEFGARWNDRVQRAIRDSGVRVVGDLADLATEADTRGLPVETTEPTPDQLLEAAEFAVSQLRRLVERGSSTQDVGTLPEPVAAFLADVDAPRRWRSDPDPVRAAVVNVAEGVRAHAAR